jgi:hypothetical protein
MISLYQGNDIWHSTYDVMILDIASSTREIEEIGEEETKDPICFGKKEETRR